MEKFLNAYSAAFGFKISTSETIVTEALLVLADYDVLQDEELETIDIDLLARRLNAEKSNVELIMQEICFLNLDDGFHMHFINLDDLDHHHMDYPGFQIGIAVQFGVMSD